MTNKKPQHDIEPYVFSEAVKQYWSILKQQGKKQKERGVSDTGTRSRSTGGKQLGGFEDKISEILVSVGVNESDIYSKKNRTLPGFFRATKQWDIIVMNNNRLLAAIELKSQTAPSYGNNLNNRAEEALGLATDFWTAFRENTFSLKSDVVVRPWLGYLFLLEDHEKVHKKVGVSEPHFKVRAEFKKSTHARRYELFLRKLVLERHYDSTCLILSKSSEAEILENYTEPSEDLSASKFLKQLISHVCTLI